MAPGLSQTVVAGSAAPPAFVSKIAGYLPKTVECRVSATFYAAAPFSVEMRVWGRPPSQWRIDITGVEPDAPPQNTLRGTRMVFTEDRVQVYDPATGRVRVRPVTPDVGARPGAAGRMGFTLAELLLIDDPANFQLEAMTPQIVDGRALVRYDFLLRRPQLVDRVLVARESLWINPRTNEPLRAQLYDPAGRAVGIIVLKDHQRVAADIPLPLTVELFLDAGGAPATTMRVTFQVKEKRFFLPLRLDGYQGATPVLSLVYSGCQVNKPLDAKLFTL